MGFKTVVFKTITTQKPFKEAVRGHREIIERIWTDSRIDPKFARKVQKYLALSFYAPILGIEM